MPVLREGQKESHPYGLAWVTEYSEAEMGTQVREGEREGFETWQEPPF